MEDYSLESTLDYVPTKVCTAIEGPVVEKNPGIGEVLTGSLRMVIATVAEVGHPGSIVSCAGSSYSFSGYS